MKRFRKFFRVLSSVLLYSLLVLLLVVSIMFVAYGVDQFIGSKNGEKRAPLFGAYVIISPSMVPNINVYDAVVTMRVSPNKIKLNDIITFLSKDINTNGTPITHRVVGIVDTEKGTKAFRTKGDNNESEDRALIKENEILGKVMLRIPMIGHVKTFLTSKIGWLIIIVVPCLILIGSDILKISGLIKKNKNKEINNINSNVINDLLNEDTNDSSDNTKLEKEIEILDFEDSEEIFSVFGKEVVIIPDDILERRKKGED